MMSRLTTIFLSLLSRILIWWPRQKQQHIFEIIWPVFRFFRKSEIKRVKKHLHRANFVPNPQAKQVYGDLFYNAWDSLRYLHKPSALPVIMRQAELLSNELAQQRPVVAISIHSGAFEILHRALTNFGVPVHLVQAMNFPAGMNQWLQKMRFHPLIQPHSPAQSPQILRKLFEKPQILALMVDQARDVRGNEVNLLGNPSYLWLRLALKAQEMGASLVLFRTFRQNGQHIISFEKVFNNPQNTQDLVSEITASVKQWIVENPTQWTWNYPRLWNLM